MSQLADWTGTAGGWDMKITRIIVSSVVRNYNNMVTKPLRLMQKPPPTA
jgi:hypothetical protein